MRPSMITVVIFLFSASFLTSCSKDSDQSKANSAQKESAPLDVGISLPLALSMRFTDQSPLNKTFQIELSCTSEVRQANVGLNIQLPEGMVLQSGKNTWQGNLDLGESKQIDFTVRATDSTPGYVIAKANVTYPGGKSFSQGTSLYLDPEKKLEQLSQTRKVTGYGDGKIHVHKNKDSQ